MAHKSEYDAAAQALGGGDGEPKKKTHVSGIHVRRGAKGGYIAKHDLEDDDHNQHHHHPEHPLVSMADVQKHMQEHLGEEKAEIAQGEGAPQIPGGEPGE